MIVLGSRYRMVGTAAPFEIPISASDSVEEGGPPPWLFSQPQALRLDRKCSGATELGVAEG